jgi:hypothetical protein
MAICFPKPEEQPVMSQTLALVEAVAGIAAWCCWKGVGVLGGVQVGE